MKNQNKQSRVTTTERRKYVGITY